MKTFFADTFAPKSFACGTFRGVVVTGGGGTYYDPGTLFRAPSRKRKAKPQPEAPVHAGITYSVRAAFALPALAIGGECRYIRMPVTFAAPVDAMESMSLDLGGAALLIESTEVEDAWLLDLPL